LSKLGLGGGGKIPRGKKKRSEIPKWKRTARLTQAKGSSRGGKNQNFVGCTLEKELR